MRVVGGSARGRALVTPAGTATRPTSDRTREALFNSLGNLSGLSFLDLYAGSGAIGLEALSRGAGSATLVELELPALQAIRANATTLGLLPTVVATRVERFLKGDATPFDVVFLDPPYALNVVPVLAAVVPWAADRVVVERATRDGEPSWPAGLALDKSRRYGETTLWYVSTR